MTDETIRGEFEFRGTSVMLSVRLRESAVNGIVVESLAPVAAPGAFYDTARLLTLAVSLSDVIKPGSSVDIPGFLTPGGLARAMLTRAQQLAAA